MSFHVIEPRRAGRAHKGVTISRQATGRIGLSWEAGALPGVSAGDRVIVMAGAGEERGRIATQKRVSHGMGHLVLAAGTPARPRFSTSFQPGCMVKGSAIPARTTWHHQHDGLLVLAVPADLMASLYADDVVDLSPLQAHALEVVSRDSGR